MEGSNGIGQQRMTDNQQIDVDKLLTILRKSIVWIAMIFLGVFLIAYLFFIRWQKPVYESVSDLKLDIKTESTLLGIENPTPNLNSISSEIELITSKYFFSRVIDELDYDVSYFYYGKILVEERYNNSPFSVEFVVNDQRWYDTKIDLDIISNSKYVLKLNEKDREYTFGDLVDLDGLQLKITKTEHFSESNGVGSYYFKINSKERLIDYFKENFTASPLNLSGSSIRVALRDNHRVKVKDFLFAIDTLYLKYTREEKNKATRLQIKYLDEQLEKTERSLEAYEEYFENFTLENKTVNLESEVSTSIARMQEIENEKYERAAALELAKEFLEDVKKDSVRALNPFASEILPAEISSQIAELEKLYTERDVLLGSHNENTFVIEKQNQRIALHKNNLVELLLNAINNLKEEIKNLSEAQKDIERNFKELPSLGTEYSKNRRNYTLYEGFYLSQLQKKAEFEIAQAGTVTDFAILSQPYIPEKPIYPKPLLVYGAAGALSFIFSFLLIGVRYLLHNKVTSVKEIEALTTVPILGAIPNYKAEKLSQTKVVVDRKPRSVLSESLRTVRTNMDFILPRSDKKIISVTSSVGGEGKTFVSVNLGAIIAMTDMKVIILDLDMRKPKVHLAFGDEAGNKGVSTILIEKNNVESCIRNTGVRNLDYIQAGPIPPNPSELILTQKFSELLGDLREKYDVIIIDTPPVGLVTDGIILMKKADLPIYVVRANYSKRSYLGIINRLLEINKFQKLTIIFNAVDEGHDRNYYYGASYTHYYDDGAVKKGRFSFITNMFNL